MKVTAHFHDSRVDVKPTPKGIRTQEDLRSTAGIRNPAAVLDRWPPLAKFLWILEAAKSNFPELQGLAGAEGKNPKRSPPSSETIPSTREQVARALCIPQVGAESHHAPSSLRLALFKWVIEASKDPTRTTWSGSRLVFPWAFEGPSRLEAVRAVAVELDESELPADWPGNHPSFACTLEGELKPQAMEIIKGYMRHGYGAVFRSRSAAEKALQSQYAIQFGLSLALPVCSMDDKVGRKVNHNPNHEI